MNGKINDCLALYLIICFIREVPYHVHSWNGLMMAKKLLRNV
jgi:hypothetical protein